MSTVVLSWEKTIKSHSKKNCPSFQIFMKSKLPKVTEHLEKIFFCFIWDKDYKKTIKIKMKRKIDPLKLFSDIFSKHQVLKCFEEAIKLFHDWFNVLCNAGVEGIFMIAKTKHSPEINVFHLNSTKYCLKWVTISLVTHPLATKFWLLFDLLLDS